ncbi:hypothetical protein RI129_010030 [Pyrocoelia pectoralis]|uniref:Chitin-binding type-2 domain-containing protein n=1 Tax=Pyrocoelia pectoralis TaxID=417401 RepID=A0AAN7ZJF5_9COLE
MSFLYYFLEFATSTDYNSAFCRQAGYACKTCNQVVQCRQNETGFTEYPIAVCDGNSSCSNGACIIGPNPHCDPPVQHINATFICRTIGMFPDPFDSQVFHHCVNVNNNSCYEGPLEHFEDRCDCDHAYNARTTFCDIPLKDYNHTSSIPKCDHQGQTGYLLENPSLYYVCQYHPTGPLRPFLYRCDNGKLYNPYNYICESYNITTIDYL